MGIKPASIKFESMSRAYKYAAFKICQLDEGMVFKRLLNVRLAWCIRDKPRLLTDGRKLRFYYSSELFNCSKCKLSVIVVCIRIKMNCLIACFG